MINGAVLGGLMLILGNFFVFKGDIYNSIKVFLLADVAWLWLAFSAGNTLGIILVLIGLILSIYAFLKMRKGIFHKKITKDI